MPNTECVFYWLQDIYSEELKSWGSEKDVRGVMCVGSVVGRRNVFRQLIGFDPNDLTGSSTRFAAKRLGRMYEN
jgi:hypothetical protein